MHIFASASGVLKVAIVWWWLFFRPRIKRTTMNSISYFQNEKGDYTITIDDQPVAFTSDEATAQVFQSMQYEIDNLQIWKNEHRGVWSKIEDYMQKHPELKLGESISEKVMSMLRERDVIFSMIKLLKSR
jgi:hypothetical protein